MSYGPHDRGTMHTGKLHLIDQTPWTDMSRGTEEKKEIGSFCMHPST